MKKIGLVNKILRFLEGIIVGFGAIMPGISGGTLCVAFGMYKPIIEVLSHPGQNLKRHFKELVFFGLGVGTGFLGLADLAAFLLEKNSTIVIFAFVGFIIGTFPELWHDAGKESEKRGAKDYISLVLGFIIMLALLIFIKSQNELSFDANFLGYLFCGVLWGLSFIVPGLSSSTLIIFFGLYQPMLNGISSFSIAVLAPLMIGVIVCVLFLSRIINLAYSKFYSAISHTIVGIVVATTVMIIPRSGVTVQALPIYILCVVGGAIISYILTLVCARLKEKAITKTEQI